MKSVDLKTHQKPYFEMDELNERFVSNKAFKQSVHIGFRNNVAEKFAKCQTAKGNFFLSENSSNMIVIANLNWLSDVINLISTGNLLSNDVQFVKKLIGKQIRLWTQEQFIKELEKLISKEKVTFSIRTILSILYGFLSLTFLFQDWRFRRILARFEFNSKNTKPKRQWGFHSAFIPLKRKHKKQKRDHKAIRLGERKRIQNHNQTREWHFYLFVSSSFKKALQQAHNQITVAKRHLKYWLFVPCHVEFFRQ